MSKFKAIMISLAVLVVSIGIGTLAVIFLPDWAWWIIIGIVLVDLFYRIYSEVR